MIDLNFDIYAMIEPKTKEDYIVLLDEAFLMAEELLEMVNNLYKEV